MKPIFCVMLACLLAGCHSKKQVLETSDTAAAATSVTIANAHAWQIDTAAIRRWLTAERLHIEVTADSVVTPGKTVIHGTRALISADRPQLTTENTSVMTAETHEEKTDSVVVAMAAQSVKAQASERGRAVPSWFAALVAVFLALGFWRLTVLLKN